MSLIDNSLAIILAIGSDSRLDPLTADRAKPAVPFGGNYRIIDFTLANCLHSGLRRVLVLTQYRSHSLQKHLRDGWSIFNPELGEFITPVPPQMRTEKHWYSGAADAIRQNLYLLERNRSDYIMVLSGEHIYRMDYAAMLDFHVEHGGDATVACLELADLGNPVSQCQVTVGVDNRVLAFESAKPRLASREGSSSVEASMEVYAFSKDVLIAAIERGDYAAKAGEDFGQDVIPHMLGSGAKVMAYRFGGEAGRVTRDRYWRRLETLDDYYDANMDLLQHDPAIDLYQQDWPIRTYQAQHPPARTVPGKSCNEGVFVNSIVASGTVISGGGVNHSILFPRVFVDDAATVEDSILLSGVAVGEGARLYRCIVDKDVQVPPGESIGYDRGKDAKRFTVTAQGIVVVPKGHRFS